MRTAARSHRQATVSPRFVLVVVLTGFLWGAAVKVALADHYHVACVGHGFVHGESTGDGSFFARVEAGCGSTLRECALYANGSFVGGATVGGTGATCNAWSRNYGNYSECASTAHDYASGVFSNHVHKAHNYCR
jgi:hypothetical protein